MFRNNILVNCLNFVWWHFSKEQKRSPLRLRLNGLHLGLGSKPPKGKCCRGCQLVSKYSALLCKVKALSYSLWGPFPPPYFRNPERAQRNLSRGSSGFSHIPCECPLREALENICRRHQSHLSLDVCVRAPYPLGTTERMERKFHRLKALTVLRFTYHSIIYKFNKIQRVLCSQKAQTVLN